MTVVMWKIASRLKRQNASRCWKQSFHKRVFKACIFVNRRKRGTRSREQQRCPSRECPKLKCQRGWPGLVRHTRHTEAPSPPRLGHLNKNYSTLLLMENSQPIAW
ncbi:hypothetical protein T11_14294 [Trichinella zimbabwensis]|uniref:Uncharacterized protein n=1 Tax=Trichinella zimbabwensis TaxID=268475 RepID=A0A0V1GWF7_9BILA|nr:hypothetical protein T11_14294 [Trichinella zimbabwensis]